MPISEKTTLWEFLKTTGRILYTPLSWSGIYKNTSEEYPFTQNTT
jgi:hypothetical protein